MVTNQSINGSYSKKSTEEDGNDLGTTGREASNSSIRYDWYRRLWEDGTATQQYSASNSETDALLGNFYLCQNSTENGPTESQS